MRGTIMRYARGAIVVGLVLTAFVSSALAASSLDIESLDASLFPGLTAKVVVLGEDGHALCGPLDGGFVVRENGDEVAGVQVEWVGEPGLRRVALVLSASQIAENHGEWSCIRDAALDALDHLDPGDEVAVIVYRGCPELLIPWTDDLEAAAAEIEGIDPSGGSPMTDGIYVGMQTVCEAGGGRVVYIGDGIELDSNSCDAPPDGLEGGGLDNDAELIHELADGCGGTLSVIHTQWLHTDWLMELSAELGGVYEVCGSVEDDDWDAVLGDPGESGDCFARISYESADPSADGSVRSVEICFDDGTMMVCDTTSYTAACAPALVLDPRTEALFSACQDAEDTVRLIVAVPPCATPDSIGAHLTAGPGTEHDLAMTSMDSEGHYGVDVPAGWFAPGDLVDLGFTADFGSTHLTLPEGGGSYQLSYCPEDTLLLTVSLGREDAQPGEEVVVPLSLSGWQGEFITSYEITIDLSRSDLTLIDVDDAGSVTADAGWMAPVFSQPSSTEIRIASAGSNSIAASGVLANLSFAVAEDAPGGCVELSLTSVVMNDGYPVPEKVDGAVCIDASCVSGRVVSWISGNPGLQDISVIDATTNEVLTRTGADGSYELCPEGNIRIAFAGGDDGGMAISALDASYVLRATVGLEDFALPVMDGSCGEFHPRAMAADVSGDGTVGSYDASLILQWLVGLISEFPEDGWKFVCSPIDVTPGSIIPDVTGVLMGDVSGAVATKGSQKSVAAEAVRWERTSQEGGHWVLRYSGDDEISSCRLSIRLPESGVHWHVPDTWLQAARARDRRLDLAMATARPVGSGAPLLYMELPASSKPPVDGMTASVDDRSAAIQTDDGPFGNSSIVAFRVSPTASGFLFEWKTEGPQAPILDIYDLRGRRVDHEILTGSSGTMRWAVRDHASAPLARGIYFARLRSSSGSTVVRKIVVTRH